MVSLSGGIVAGGGGIVWKKVLFLAYGGDGGRICRDFAMRLGLTYFSGQVAKAENGKGLGDLLG